MRWIVLLVLLACSSEVAAQANFQDVSIGVPMFSTVNARSVAIADFDNDGDDDILIAAQPTKLYRNEGNFSFTEIAQASGINFTATLAVWFDADDDGWLDVILSTIGSLKFYKSDQDGTFTEATSASNFYAAANQAFLVGDLNGDQLLDVYTNNLNKPNQLFINKGDAEFVDVASGSGAEWSSLAMGGVLVDIGHDNDLDIYVVFDGKKPNQLFLNDGHGHFTNGSSVYQLDAKSEAMGVDFADFNHDGRYDFYISNLYENLLLLQQPNSTYTDIAKAAGVDDKGMGWGIFCFDYNNDTYSDVYVVNTYGYNLFSNLLYKNNGDNTFTDVAPGTALEVNKTGYGGATGDFNSDGKPDIVVANFNSEGVTVLKNNEAGVGNWIEINLVGTSTNKFGVGSRVEVQLGSLILLDEVTIGSGYKSQNSYRVHIGVNNASSIDEVRIQWPDGTTNAYQNIAPNNRYLAIQNESLSVFNPSEYLQALTRVSLLVAPPDTFETGPTLEGNTVARLWNEALLNSIRNDFARPTVHARNLFHISMAMYDAWAAFDPNVSPYFLGQMHGDFYCPFTGIATPENIAQAREEAISYAAFRMLSHRFANSPGADQSLTSAKKLLDNLGYDQLFTSTDYSSGSPAALGNYIASKIIEFGLQDGSNEVNGYANQVYQPVNIPMRPEVPGNLNCTDPNRWQQIQLVVSIDQNGQPVSSTPPFLGPEWGKVFPFALKESDLNKFDRDGNEWWVYHDPGQPPLLDTMTVGGLSEEFKWNFELVSIWASHLDPSDSVKIDISPASKGNIALDDYPTTVQAYHDFYNLEEGGDIGQGYATNPKTNQPYTPQIVPRGDYARVLAEFWADGPKSETPPGHWFTILNYVTDHPDFQRKFQGEGDELDPLEWDVKAYLVLGGALHDVAISAWGIKGYYDYTRPVFAIRYMADHGQSSDSGLPNYHPGGLPLKQGFVELVEEGDPLAGAANEHVGKIKLYTWRGPNYISDPKTEMAGVGWILAENWWPYQRPTFVTPPFAGYISGHSTYSSAAAEVLTRLTGDEYFPGGMGEFVAKKNQYLVFEEGPSRDIKLQWARYKDASDQSSLSRIWGGIHPPIDDIPGRFIGKEIGRNAFIHAEKYFNGLVSAIEEERPQIETSLYPNPILSDALNIRTTHDISSLSIEVFDMSGKLMFKKQFPETTRQFVVSTVTIPNGMYIVRLKGSNYYSHQKILIRR